MSGAAPIDELKALAHPLRFRILTSLSHGERNVGEIESATGIAQPALSQQLAVLRKAGLVETRKDAKLVFYALRRDVLEHAASAIATLSGGVRAPLTAPPTRQSGQGVANFARMA